MLDTIKSLNSEYSLVMLVLLFIVNSFLTIYVSAIIFNSKENQSVFDKVNTRIHEYCHMIFAKMLGIKGTLDKTKHVTENAVDLETFNYEYENTFIKSFYTIFINLAPILMIPLVLLIFSIKINIITFIVLLIFCFIFNFYIVSIGDFEEILKSENLYKNIIFSVILAFIYLKISITVNAINIDSNLKFSIILFLLLLLLFFNQLHTRISSLVATILFIILFILADNSIYLFIQYLQIFLIASIISNFVKYILFTIKN